MAKMDGKMLWVIIGVVVLAYFMMGKGTTTTTTITQTTQPATTGGSVDLCTVVAPGVTFTGQRQYLSGTATPLENVTVFKMNGGTVVKNLGKTSLNSGSLAVTANGPYKFMCGYPSTTYYANLVQYTGKCQEANDDFVCTLCAADTTPTITVYDDNGDTNSASNTIAVTTSDTVDATVKVKISPQQCYGMPQATVGNAICFDFNSSVYQSVSVPGASVISAPYAISSAKAAGSSEACYEFAKLADNADVKLAIQIKSLSVEPTAKNGNITVKITDAGFDINQDTLSEIYGFQDEDNNAIGLAGVDTATIRIG